LIVHRAAWVLPIDARPIRNGWVAVDRGTIVGVGGGSGDALAAPESLAILPGLVNAHVHLELAWMRGSVPPASSMPVWASRLIERRRVPAAEAQESISAAVEEARVFGTTLVGEVTNTLAAYESIAGSALHAAIFFEQLGFNAEDGEARVEAAEARLDALPQHERVRSSVVPHAPYSVSPAVLRAIAALGRSRIVSVHLAESAEEVQFLADGTGAWRAILEQLGVWDANWKCPRCSPVEYLERCGLLNDGLLAVHGVQLTDPELRTLAAAGATVVTCPRSNVWTGAGAPPVSRFYRSGVRVAVGTDSLASVDDLNVFSELAALRKAAPDVPAGQLLRSATQAGAEALGFAAELGTIAPGKRAELIAVRVPADLKDVEEYLVGGIQSADIRWLENE
jgi:cytosine/adenosine deaminase-related metal-dependent hydrolase